ncbi:MAG: ATP-binding cassette domain-containing protein [Bacteroidia bacterium]|nr:ATP-binding cassette domain-containing protein [Bacteroidia bacterium]
MIEIRNIKKSFEERPILKDISTLFEKGKTNLIIGQSGSGKTVLLKSIVRLIEVDEGEILFDGRDIRKMNFKDIKLLRQEMGMVFQGGALFDSLNVEENVQFPMDMFTTMTTAEKSKHVDFCLDRVNIKGAHHLYPSEISGGMRKRVAIARAIALNPEGEKGWVGNSTQVLFTRNKKLNEFVFASPLSKRIRDLKQREDDE